jgi:hypothetical protein
VSGWVTFELRQPSARREWQLIERDAVRASLQVPAFRAGARAEAGARRLRIEQQGRLRRAYVVREDATGEEIARIDRHGRRQVLELGGRTAEWGRLGRKEGHGFVAERGRPLLRASVRSGILRSSGEVQVDPELGDRDALVAALLAAFLLIRRNDEAAVAATG